MQRKRPWARFLGSPAARVPILHGRPDMFAGALRLIAQIVDIETVDHAIFHADVAVDDHRVDVVADAALDQALDGSRTAAITQGLPATKIDDQNIRQRACGELAEIVAPERARAAEGGASNTSPADAL